MKKKSKEWGGRHRRASRDSDAVMNGAQSTTIQKELLFSAIHVEIRKRSILIKSHHPELPVYRHIYHEWSPWTALFHDGLSYHLEKIHISFFENQYSLHSDMLLIPVELHDKLWQKLFTYSVMQLCKRFFCPSSEHTVRTVNLCIPNGKDNTEIITNLTLSH